MQKLDAAEIYHEIEREVARTAYPESFPPLPKVPSARYTDPHFFELEMRHVWRKSWLTVGHVSELATPGAYKLFEKLKLSVIISRGLDGEIRAFHNVCQHRGSALLLEKEGVARRFVCPYHSWGYALDGSLVSVPEAHNFACLDKAESGLVPVRCEVWQGLIFVNFDNDAGSFADYIAPIARQIADYPIGDLVLKGTVKVEVDCNWKAAYDNFLEIYHVNTVHATSLAPFLNSKSFTVSLFKGGHSRFATRKKASATVFGYEVDVRPELKERFREHTIALPIFPNTFSTLDPIGITWLTFWPIAPNKTYMELPLLGWKNDSEEDRQFWENHIKTTYSLLGEDAVLFGGIQRALESGVLPGITMGCQERALYWYQEEIDRLIGPENIPEALRVTPVLAGQAKD